jgi:hypothetical protein
VTPAAQQSLELSAHDQARAEIALAKRLRIHGVKVDDGLTTLEQRREAFRDAITARGIELVIAWKTKNGKPMTYGQAFQRIYGRPLRPTSAHTRRTTDV